MPPTTVFQIKLRKDQSCICSLWQFQTDWNYRQLKEEHWLFKYLENNFIKIETEKTHHLGLPRYFSS